MKITRILPKKFAIDWQKYDLARTDGKLEYHKTMVSVLEEMSDQGHAELRHLKGGKNRIE